MNISNVKIIIKALVFLAAPLTALTQPAVRDIATLAFSSTVFISVEDEKGQLLKIGSGFVAGEGIVATNRHVIDQAASGNIRLVGTKQSYKIVGVVAESEEWDLAILSIPTLAAPPMKLGNFESVAVGDAVFAVGNPQGLEGTFSQGIVSSIRGEAGNRLLQITAPISPGSSGGPVLNDRGEVIGISVATYREGQNLNFAIPVGELTKLKSRMADRPRSLATVKRNSKDDSPNGSGETLRSSVSASNFRWSNASSGFYTFSLQNKLLESVRNVVCLVIFYDKDDLPIDSENVFIPDPIGPSLAKRTSRQGERPGSEVKDITSRVEIRVMNFDVGEGVVYADRFLIENRKKPGVAVTSSGLQYKVLREGRGAAPRSDQSVRVHYQGLLVDGSVFDSSVRRGEPAAFRVSEVIPGWAEALQLMSVGAKWRLYIPAALAYGERGAGPIPPNSTLIFDVELLEIY